MAAASHNKIASFAPKFPNEVKAHNSELTLMKAYEAVLSVGKHNGKKGCIMEEELADLLLQSANKKYTIRAYDGFEPSGRMHIAQGLMKTVNVNKMTSAGIEFVMLVADWFAMLNNKFDGDLSKIRLVGQYFVEVWKASGMDLEKVKFLWSSEEINKSHDEYWSLVMDIARCNSVARIKRCGQIMGRKDTSTGAGFKSVLTEMLRCRKEDAKLNDDEFEQKYSALYAKSCMGSASEESQPVAQLLYPLMQCADIFMLKASICQLGLDQLKVNVLAREYCDQLKTKGKKRGGRRLRKPIVLSHPMLMGLKEGQAKMSKSDPDSAIFMEDTAGDVNRKLKKAYCKPKDVEENPVLDYLEKIVFAWHENTPDEFGFAVSRSDSDGGDALYKTFEAVASDFASGALHPADLKPAVARELNKLLEPVRKHFSSGEPRELLKRIKSFKKQ